MGYDLDIVRVAQFVHNVRDGGNIQNTTDFRNMLFTKFDQIILDVWAQTGRAPLTDDERASIAAMASCDAAPFPDAAVGDAVAEFIKYQGV